MNTRRKSLMQRDSGSPLGAAVVRALLFATLVVVTASAASCGGDGVAEGALTSGEDEHAGEAGILEVHLDPEALARSGIETGTAREVSTARLPVTGNITYDQNRVSHIGPKTEGRVDELVVEVGSRVDDGQILAHLESAEVGTTRAELNEALALLEIATENYDREVRLEGQGISSRREVLDAEAELRRVQASLRSAEERLRVLGAEDHGEGSHFDLTSPYAGVVVERHASRGEVVGPSDRLFTVADLSRVWIELDIYERNLRQVAVDLPVEVTTAAWAGRSFPGRIVYVGDILDPDRRTVRARVEVENDDGALKPGMFATAAIELAGGQGVVAVPRDAVQLVENETVVWVPGDEPGSFVPRPVLTGAELDADLVEIVSGLVVGEPLVVRGAFTLKAELAKGEFGGHGH